MKTWRRAIRVVAVFIAIVALVATAERRGIAGEPILLPDGELNPKCDGLRLWLRADDGIADGQGRGPSDPDFDGMVATWKDRSPEKFNLTAVPERVPLYVSKQAAAGNRPTVAFNGRQRMTGGADPLFDKPTSTTIVVLHGKFGGENCVYSAGNSQERLMLGFTGDSEPSWQHLSYSFHTSAGVRGHGIGLNLPKDGNQGSRFAIVMLSGDEDQRTIEFHDGLGDTLGELREIIPLTPAKQASDQIKARFFLGGSIPEEAHLNFNGQIAEMIVLNRGLSTTERREILTYLNRRYQFDSIPDLLPPDSFLLQVEDFEGKWLVPPWNPGTPYLGGRHATTEVKDQPDPGMKKTITIPRDGKYHIWVRAFENSFPRNATRLQTFIQGQELAVTHIRGPRDAIVWREAGEVQLKTGPAEIIIRGEGPGGKDCDAILISPTAETIEAVEEACAYMQRLRHISGKSQITAVYADGLRMDGSLVTGFHWSNPVGPTTRPEKNRGAQLQCLQFERPSENAGNGLGALFEFLNGDQIRGTITGFLPGTMTDGKRNSSQLQIRLPPDYFRDPKLVASVEIDWLRRIVFDPSGRQRPCPPKTVIARDGRKIPFTAIRWGAESLSLLTDEGLIKVPLAEIAEIRLPDVDPWEMYFRELATIDPEGKGQIVRWSTADGMNFTASSSRCAALRVEGEYLASRHSIHPVWSVTSIPVPWVNIIRIWRSPADIVPLVRFLPATSIQRESFGKSWSMKMDRNVVGGPLKTGGRFALWGYGVHAPQEMSLILPDCAKGFHAQVGVDASVGTAGNAVAKVELDQATRTRLYQSKPLLGGEPSEYTGVIALPVANGKPRRLILVVENGGSGEVFDLGNHIDWVQPTLLLDPAGLKGEVAKRLAPASK